MADDTAGSTTWYLQEADNAGETEEHEHPDRKNHAGETAWFVRKHYRYRIRKMCTDLTEPDSYGTKRGALQYSVGEFSRTVPAESGAQWICTGDKITPAQPPLSQTYREQTWEMIGSKLIRITEWTKSQDLLDAPTS